MFWRKLFRRQREPLMLAPKTYNTRHPDYDARAAQNHPGRITNARASEPHPILAEIAALGSGTHVDAARWQPTFAAMRAEVESDPAGARLFADRRALEAQLEEMNR